MAIFFSPCDKSTVVLRLFRVFTSIFLLLLLLLLLLLFFFFFFVYFILAIYFFYFMRLFLENTFIRLSILSFILFKYSNKFLFGFDWRWWVCYGGGQWWIVTKQQGGVNVFFLLMSVNLGVRLRGCFN